jgi:hypothetical protein
MSQLVRVLLLIVATFLLALATAHAQPSSPSGDYLGGILLDAPSCLSWGPNRIDCFARGTDLALFRRAWDGSTWLPWERLDGALLDAPSCVSSEPNRIDCFARGDDRAMIHRQWPQP